MAADAETYRVTRALRDTPRWALAPHDANLSFPEAADAFSCALVADGGLATYAAQDHCGAHWQSDVTADRVVAAGVVARLHADATFRADLAAAKGELAAARRRGLRPTRDCGAEAAALAVTWP
jgi:hypothetical protein